MNYEIAHPRVFVGLVFILGIIVGALLGNDQTRAEAFTAIRGATHTVATEVASATK